MNRLVTSQLAVVVEEGREGGLEAKGWIWESGAERSGVSGGYHGLERHLN